MKVFGNENEAWEYVDGIQDEKEQLLTRIGMGRTISFLLADDAYVKVCQQTPLDMLLHARVLHAIFRMKEDVAGVLAGTIRSIDDLDPLKGFE